jgi:dTDP-4-dehydrorhamnose reductase
MMHFSTDYVFNGSGDRPWREDDHADPLSIYGASKLAGEAGIREAAGSHLIIRTSWVFASKGKNFLTTITRLARERTELRVVADQIGAPTSARSIAQAVISILCGPGSERRDVDLVKRRFASLGGLVHVSNAGKTNWHDFAVAIVSGLRLRTNRLVVTDIIAIGTKDFPTRAVRPLNSRLDLTRLKMIGGVRTPCWQQALDIELNDLSTEENI